MKFHSVSSDLGKETVRIAQGRFNQMMLELGVRNNNEHVGSGLGGNNFQLLVLMSLQHKLTNSHNTQMSITPEGIIWGSHFLVEASRKQLRRKLDIMFPVIQEKHKILAAAMEGAIDSHSYYKKFYQYRESFPSITQYLESSIYRHNSSMPYHEQLLMALFITADLSVELDRGITKKIGIAGRALDQFPNDIYLLAVRRNIGIDRLVKFSLDEYSDWIPALNRIYKEIN